MSYLHGDMINDALPSGGTLQKVVDFSLERCPHGVPPLSFDKATGHLAPFRWPSIQGHLNRPSYWKDFKSVLRLIFFKFLFLTRCLCFSRVANGSSLLLEQTAFRFGGHSLQKSFVALDTFHPPLSLRQRRLIFIILVQGCHFHDNVHHGHGWRNELFTVTGQRSRLRRYAAHTILPEVGKRRR